MARFEGVITFCISACLSLSYLLLIIHVAEAANSPRIAIRRSNFPKGFIFGAGTSAYQVEGAAREGGKGPSSWDTLSHIPGKIADGKNGDVAVDQYHRFKEDVQLLKYMGMDVYRFSIAWSRIFPKGSLRHGGRVNAEGIAYYNNLINELLKNGMEPFVTLFHWDVPQVLEDEYGGFRSRKVVEDFAIYAEECFRAFGDRVKYWLTINEQLIFGTYGYAHGIHAPGRCSPGYGNCTAGNSESEPYIVVHNTLLAHSAAVKIYRTKYQVNQKGSIGIALVANWMVPVSNSSLDRRVTQRAIDFRIGWFLDPLTGGSYPKSMQILVGPRLPSFSSKEAKDLIGSFDFIGYNYYITQFAINSPFPEPNSLSSVDNVLDAGVKLTYEVNGNYIGTEQGCGARSYPPGIMEVINYTKHRYNNPPIYITEVGYCDFDNGTIPLEQAINDSGRLKFHSDHLQYLLQAIREGADVRGYVVWSFLDNFEWASGFNSRYGLYYVDHNDNLKRHARASARWFKEILQL